MNTMEKAEEDKEPPYTQAFSSFDSPLKGYCNSLAQTETLLKTFALNTGTFFNYRTSIDKRISDNGTVDEDTEWVKDESIIYRDLTNRKCIDVDVLMRSVPKGYVVGVILDISKTNFERYTITDKQIMCLNLGQQLNDVVLNALLLAITKKYNTDHQTEKATVVHSDMFNKSLQGGKESDLKKYISDPAKAMMDTRWMVGFIYKRNHYILLMLDTHQYDIIYLDPLGSHDTHLKTTVCENARWVLREIYMYRMSHNLIGKNTYFTSRKQVKDVEQTLQTDGHNCGVFVAKFLESYLKDKKIDKQITTDFEADMRNSLLGVVINQLDCFGGDKSPWCRKCGECDVVAPAAVCPKCESWFCDQCKPMLSDITTNEKCDWCRTSTDQKTEDDDRIAVDDGHIFKDEETIENDCYIVQSPRKASTSSHEIDITLRDKIHGYTTTMPNPKHRRKKLLVNIDHKDDGELPDMPRNMASPSEVSGNSVLPSTSQASDTTTKRKRKGADGMESKNKKKKKSDNEVGQPLKTSTPKPVTTPPRKIPEDAEFYLTLKCIARCKVCQVCRPKKPGAISFTKPNDLVVGVWGMRDKPVRGVPGKFEKAPGNLYFHPHCVKFGNLKKDCFFKDFNGEVNPLEETRKFLTLEVLQDLARAGVHVTNNWY